MKATVKAMTESHPEIVAELVALSAHMFTMGPDGMGRSTRSGKVRWEPSTESILVDRFADSYNPDGVSGCICNPSCRPFPNLGIRAIGAW